jgi:hypothetical protein
MHTPTQKINGWGSNSDRDRRRHAESTDEQRLRESNHRGKVCKKPGQSQNTVRPWTGLKLISQFFSANAGYMTFLIAATYICQDAYNKFFTLVQRCSAETLRGARGVRLYTA